MTKMEEIDRLSFRPTLAEYPRTALLTRGGRKHRAFFIQPYLASNACLDVLRVAYMTA